MPESRAPSRKIVGTTYPNVGKIVVRRMHGKEHHAVDGTHYPSPQLEERLLIRVERDGVAVGYGVAILPPAPDPNAKPPRSPEDEEMLAAELTEFFGV